MTAPIDVWKPGTAPFYAGPALIDTHIWLWYLNGERERMSRSALRLLTRMAAGEGLLVSDISIWEVGNKVSKGKLSVAPTLTLWLDRAGRAPGLRFLPLDRDTVLASTQLPGEVRGDPADRMLMAAASLYGVPLVTADYAIIDYASAQGTLSVCDARG